MVKEGSIGIASFKKIVMQNEVAQEGVRISGYDRLKQDSGKNKEKRQKGAKEPSSNRQVKEKES